MVGAHAIRVVGAVGLHVVTALLREFDRGNSVGTNSAMNLLTEVLSLERSFT